MYKITGKTCITKTAASRTARHSTETLTTALAYTKLYKKSMHTWSLELNYMQHSDIAK